MEPIWETLLLCWTGNLHQPPECWTSPPPQHMKPGSICLLGKGEGWLCLTNKFSTKMKKAAWQAVCILSTFLPQEKSLNCVLSTEVPRHQGRMAGGNGEENTSFWAGDKLNSFSRCFPNNQGPKPSMSSQSTFSIVTFGGVPSNVTTQSVFFLKTSPLFPANHLQPAFPP